MKSREREKNRRKKEEGGRGEGGSEGDKMS